MADETNKPAEEAAPTEVAAEVVDPAKAEEPPPASQHAWEYRDGFKINGRMREVVQLTIGAAEAELAMLRRKLEKLTYGS